MYTEHLAEFAGQQVIDFNSAEDWRGEGICYRIRAEYDDEVTVADRLEVLANQPGASNLKALVIGAWEEAFESGGSQELVERLIESAPRFPNLRSLFFADITYEECELSWIQHGDMTPLLQAFPKLEEFRVRGASGLSFSPLSHAGLKHFAIESGGTARSILREISRANLPQLEHLELLLGEPHYGFDGGVEDLQPLLSGKLFTKLKYLGLMNSEIADEIAAVVVNAPLLQRLETLDLSMGNLTDAGAKSLMHLPADSGLKRLKILHHYASQQAMEELQNQLSCDLEEEASESADGDWRPILHAE